MRHIWCLLRWLLLSLPSPSWLIFPKSFPLLFFSVAGALWWSHRGSLYGSDRGGLLILSGLLLSFTSFDFPHFVSFHGYLALACPCVFRAVAESCMRVICIPLEPLEVCDCHVDSPVVLFLSLRCFYIYFILSSLVFWSPSRLAPHNITKIQFRYFSRSLREQ